MREVRTLETSSFSVDLEREVAVWTKPMLRWHKIGLSVDQADAKVTQNRVRSTLNLTQIKRKKAMHGLRC